MSSHLNLRSSSIESHHRGADRVICAIMQPTYLSWLGYYSLLDSADKFVFLDDVQVCNRSWGVRNRIRSDTGVITLTVPVKRSQMRTNRMFNNVSPDYEQPWVGKHLRTIKQAYKKAPFFWEVYPDLERTVSRHYETIGDLNIAIIEALASKSGILTEVVRSSLIPQSGQRKDARLLEICEAIGASIYVAAPGSAVYIEASNPSGAFLHSPVELRYQEYVHPTYPQCDENFVSHMSFVDLLMNCGYQSSLQILRSGQRPPISSRELAERSMDLAVAYGKGEGV
jgi:hypothetical protein